MEAISELRASLSLVELTKENILSFILITQHEITLDIIPGFRRGLRDKPSDSDNHSRFQTPAFSN